jgi:hypothetical protein
MISKFLDLLASGSRRLVNSCIYASNSQILPKAMKKGLSGLNMRVAKDILSSSFQSIFTSLDCSNMLLLRCYMSL